MPKKTAHPRLRSHRWKTAQGECRQAYYFDMRGTGKPDIPLGTDFARAVLKWSELYHEAPKMAGTLEEAFKKWETEELPNYTNATTRRNYAQSLKTLRRVFGPSAWENVRVKTIADYLKKRTGKTQANREKAVLSVIWGKAREWEMTDLPFPAYKMRLKNPEHAVVVEWTEEMFAAMYVHAEPFLRDAMDLISATGWRVRDALKCQITDVRGDWLRFQANKTGKIGSLFLRDPSKQVLAKLIERRKALKAPHLMMLSRNGRGVTERNLTDAWTRARDKAVKQCPDVAGVTLRHVRKYAGQIVGSLKEAQDLLQHGSGATTQRHYRPSEKLRPAR